MIAIDTNILLRYILRDDVTQAKKATHLIEQTIAKDGSLFINRLVLCEVVWVLHQSYRLPKSEIITIIETLLETEGFEIDAQEEARKALEYYRQHNLNFSDAFIAVDNQHAGAAPTMTFDRKAARLPHFKLLK